MSPPADVNAAVFHAFGLLVAHALHVMALHSEKRGHTVKTGPVIANSLKATVFWAGLQVNVLAHTLLSSQIVVKGALTQNLQ